MRTLKNYIINHFLLNIFVAVCILTFVLSIGALFKFTDLLARGVDPVALFGLLLSGIPLALSFAIPLGTMIASLLLFDRLSTDGEITAMRACGISLRQVAGFLVLPALFLSVACIYIHSELEPHKRHIRWKVMQRIGIDNATDLLEEGRMMKMFDGLSIYIDKISDRKIEGIRIYDEREPGRIREIRANRGTIHMPADSRDIELLLEEVTVDPFSFDSPGIAYCEKWSLVLPNERRSRDFQPRDADQSFSELFWSARRVMRESERAEETAGIEAVQEKRVRAMKMLVTLNSRLVLAISPMCFIFFGITMGIRPQRKDSTRGIGFSLLAVFAFLLLNSLSSQLAGHPEVRPDLLAWTPLVLLAVLNTLLFRRLD